MAKNKIRNKRRIPKIGLVSRSILGIEKRFIENHFNFIKCSMKSKKLICIGSIQPTSLSKIYTFRIEYDGFNPPSVYVDSPVIEYKKEIHMYPKDKSLCLYYPKDMHWDRFNHRLFSSIIPWTLEWFIFYEKYKISGKWEHPEVHFS